MTSIVVNAVKFHSISETHGYAVEKFDDKYAISFVQKIVRGGQSVLLREAFSKSVGQPLKYASPFVADYVIRTEILPLYKRSTC